MIVTVVYVHVKDKHTDDFIEATRRNHLESVKEPGNLRFDVIRNSEEPQKFILYEAYESEEAAANHKKTPHYLAWREAVAGWMAEPRQGIRYDVLFMDK